ncbi:MAG: 2-oxo acid dehydrogenase subunit E2 [Spirochaetales bacterium]|nr:2-oxo acid dehydrogenase subunit E2 [Spirochaetales bacterium]
MATQVLMPRQGNTVESCLILEWKKDEGDKIEAGEVLCEVETDKATFEVEAETGGTVLKLFFEEADDVPVLTPIAVIGEEGEDISGLGPETSESESEKAQKEGGPEGVVDRDLKDSGPQSQPSGGEQKTETSTEAQTASTTRESGDTAVSPRARMTAGQKGIDPSTLAGSGPGGRVIERDVEKAASAGQPLSPAAREAAAAGGGTVPAQGSGIGGRVMSSDLGTGAPAPAAASAASALEFPGPVEEVPVKSVRKVIAQRMHESLQKTAQLTMHSSADARELLSYRKQLKNAPESLGVNNISINDLVLYVTSRTLLEFPQMNSHFLGSTMKRFAHVHLGFAVDTDRGLMVPVIKNAHALSLREISSETKRLAEACLNGTIGPDDMGSGTFTVTNLGAFGIESFTPVLNPPEAGILGVNTIQPKPVTNQEGETDFVPHIGLSLTIDHQAVDGAPAARFLNVLTKRIASLTITLAG